MKGVITEVIDSGNMGSINCGSGNVYTFASEQLTAGYQPLLKDIVEFDLIEDRPFNIHLYHRSRLDAPDSTSIDLKIECPHCGHKIIPKARMVGNKVVSTECPNCGKTLDLSERPPKTSFWLWSVAILCALLVASFVYAIFTL